MAKRRCFVQKNSGITRHVCITMFFACSVLFVVQAQKNYDSFNLEVEIADIHKEIQPGKDLWFTTKILNLANKERIDITLQYAITDAEGHDILKSSETVAIETQASFVGKMPVPDSVDEGLYVLEVILITPTQEKQSRESFRVAEEKNDKGVVIEFSLFDITFDIEEEIIGSSEDLEAVVTFTSFGNIPTPVDMNFIIRDEQGTDVYREKTNITVLTEALLRWNYTQMGVLPPGQYTAVLQTLYGENVFDEFTQEFVIKDEPAVKNNSMAFLIPLIFGIILIGFGVAIWRVRNERIRKGNTAIAQKKLTQKRGMQ